MAQEFSLRPLLSPGSAVDETPVALEGSFRVHMKREDMRVKDLANGDHILLYCKSDVANRSGVGIAWLSSDAPAKTQGSAPFVKISHAQNERCGFEYKNKCIISPFQGSLKQIGIIHVADISSGNIEEVEEEYLKRWVAVSLGKLSLVPVVTQLCTRTSISSMYRRFSALLWTDLAMIFQQMH
jgi:hypothetical protein